MCWHRRIRELELIIVDDGSTDDSCSVIESIKDPRIKLYRSGAERAYQSCDKLWISKGDRNISCKDRQ